MLQTFTFLRMDFNLFIQRFCHNYSSFIRNYHVAWWCRMMLIRWISAALVVAILLIVERLVTSLFHAHFHCNYSFLLHFSTNRLPKSIANMLILKNWEREVTIGEDFIQMKTRVLSSVKMKIFVYSELLSSKELVANLSFQNLQSTKHTWEISSTRRPITVRLANSQSLFNSILSHILFACPPINTFDRKWRKISVLELLLFECSAKMDWAGTLNMDKSMNVCVGVCVCRVHTCIYISVYEHPLYLVIFNIAFHWLPIVNQYDHWSYSTHCSLISLSIVWIDVQRDNVNSNNEIFINYIIIILFSFDYFCYYFHGIRSLLWSINNDCALHSALECAHLFSDTLCLR